MSGIDDLQNERAKEQSDFEDAFEDILGKTDEEIEASLKEAKEKEEAEREAGKATKDVKPETDPEADYSFSNDVSEGIGQKPVEPAAATETDKTDWQRKAEELEAELSKERQRTASWDGRIKSANEKTKKLEEQVATLLKDREETTKTKTAAQDLSDKEKMDLFKENFPELGDFADIMQRKLDAAVVPTQAKVEIESTQVKPEEKPAETTGGGSDHYRAITKEHPDLDEMVNTGVLLTWINGQEDYIRSHLEDVYKKGDADAVIKMATEFKNKTGWKSSVIVKKDTTKQDKLKGMLEAEGESPGPKKGEPNKDDFAGAAKEIGL